MTGSSYSLAPIWFTDVAGSALIIVLSFLAVWYAVRLAKAQPSNVIWIYLLWLCVALAVFGVSRGVGHIAKRFLLLMDMRDVWISLRSYSGAFNTLAFVVVASITLFFQRIHRINTAILKDKEALEQASQEVMHLNRNLETLVRHRTEELSLSEKKYRRIFEGSMDMIFILDEKGDFVDINRAGLDVLGFQNRDDFIGKVSLGGLFASGEEFDQLMSGLHANGFVRDRQCRLRKSEETEVFLLLSATSRRDASGKIVSYEGIAKDVTARLYMERQLQQAEKLASLGQISTGIAHEINNPLGVMLGYTQLLLRDHPSGSQIHDDLKTIEKHARNCKAVVEDLLKFSRSTQTRKSSIDINQCVGEVISLLEHQFELDKITVETRLSPNLPRVTADGEKLQQVFMNLLMNARQAISGKGRISVGTEGDPGTRAIRVVFSDDGCGIAAEHIDKIFDPFFSTKPVGEGTGLGLSVSYGIVQDHNGRIQVESRPGKGSTFTVVLPVEQDGESASRIEASQ
ncbi:MAG: PAS domain S-box protein [Desulfomonile tiedjei]|nr:PAS domain S-box protein [Desulfomonile tiedjei]